MKKKILIIDDSNFSRKILRKILEEADCTVVEAADGMNALEVFMMESPDAVFLDLNMPGINGLDVLSKLVQFNPKARVAIASADIQEATKKIAMDLGATVYVNKPLYEEIVLKTLYTLIN
jgi:two-component system chemotaxis response regulator CheY